MAESAATSQSFIVKIWIEETAAEAGRVLWRGHVTHVPSGNRCYFQDLDTMLSFMKAHLVGLGI
jgi:hypothetical protein